MIDGAVYRAGGNQCLVAEVKKTVTIFERMRGLLGRPTLALGQGLLIEPCPSVHTAFMRYPLDLIFLDSKGHVCERVAALAPWRVAACSRAWATLELAAGGIAAAGIDDDEVLEWRPL